MEKPLGGTSALLPSEMALSILDFPCGFAGGIPQGCLPDTKPHHPRTLQ